MATTATKCHLPGNYNTLAVTILYFFFLLALNRKSVVVLLGVTGSVVLRLDQVDFMQ